MQVLVQLAAASAPDTQSNAACALANLVADEDDIKSALAEVPYAFGALVELLRQRPLHKFWNAHFTYVQLRYKLLNVHCRCGRRFETAARFRAKALINTIGGFCEQKCFQTA